MGRFDDIGAFGVDDLDSTFFVPGASGASVGFNIDDGECELDLETTLIRAKLELGQGVNGHVPVFRLPHLDVAELTAFNRMILSDTWFSRNCDVIVSIGEDGCRNVFLIRKEDLPLWKDGGCISQIEDVCKNPQFYTVIQYCVDVVMGQPPRVRRGNSLRLRERGGLGFDPRALRPEMSKGRGGND